MRIFRIPWDSYLFIKTEKEELVFIELRQIDPPLKKKPSIYIRTFFEGIYKGKNEIIFSCFWKITGNPYVVTLRSRKKLFEFFVTEAWVF